MKHKQIKLAILDDSVFYNRLLSRELESYSEILKMNYPVEYKINSYSNIDSFLKDLNKDLDLAFIDFYLGENIDGGDIAQKIILKYNTCEVVVISQCKTLKTIAKSKVCGASTFLYKDNNALEEACFILQSVTKKILGYA